MSEYKILITSHKIQEKVNEIAKKIANDYKGQEFVLISVLNGSFIFAADLSRAIWNHGHINFEIDFVRITSYGNKRKSSKKPLLTKEIECSIENRNIIIVEDIIETGHTLKFLVKFLEAKNPKDIKICTLLSKDLRELEIEPDYVGFKLKKEDWVEGYGLDTASMGRARSDIVVRND